MIGQRVNTPHGLGKVVDEDKTAYYPQRSNMKDGQKRWGVRLDKSPFAFNPAYYCDKELESLDNAAEPVVE